MTTIPFNPRQQLFYRRDLIPSEPDSLWRIEKGVVRTLTRTEAGTLATLGYWGPGDVIGQPLSRIKPHQMECLTDVEVSLLPPQRWPHMLEAIFLYAQQTEEFLNILHQERVHLRLLQMLNWLALKFGRSVNQGVLIDVPLTHQSIAEVIGTSRVTITRLLEVFEYEGLIVRFRRHIILLPDRYCKLAA